MKPVRVCCFCEKWASGGIESFLNNILLHMDPEAVQVDIVAAELAESVFTRPLQKYGVRFVELSGKQHRLRKNHHMFRELLRLEQYDVVHLNIFHGLSLYYACLAKREGVPVRIAHSHNPALRQSRTKAVKQLIHHTSKELFTGSATDLWACSEAAAEFLFSKSVVKDRGFQFIPNGIDVERFRFHIAEREQTREKLGLRGKFVIGNIGRLCCQKNQDFLLDVFSEVIRRRPESRLLLIGEGEAEAELRQKAKRLGISDGVIFYGTSAHVEQLLWAMDVFVMPSRFEGLPVTSIEAQASGIPCLFSDSITQECRAGNRTRFLPLSTPASIWADAILQERSLENRSDGVPAVRRAGFDAADTAHWIEQFYLRSDSYE